jgi:CBS domain-containing protein
MTTDVCTIGPDQTIREAARTMAERDIGFIPVEENDRMVGMITDRDIAIRALAQGKGGDTPVRDVMSREVRYCYEDEKIEDVLANMGDLQVRRLPVVNRDKRLVGVISLSDCASAERARPAASALDRITRPGGDHSQRLH